jgi:hypothetical protein
MKWVYMALINGEVSAFHKKKSVMKDYLSGYKDSNPDDKCYLAKITAKSAKEMREYENLYLEDSGEGLVQRKYVDTYLIMSSYGESETSKLVRKLESLLEKDRCSKKDRNTVLDIIKDLRRIDQKYFYTPSLRVLREEYWKIEEYRNKLY